MSAPLSRLAGLLLAVVPPAAAGAAGWAVWRVFGGGQVGSDGAWQFDQATHGVLNDWLSPVMTAVLRQGFFKWWAAAPVVRLQAVVTCVGLYVLARATFRYALPGLVGGWKEAAAALGVVLLLLCPPSPLPYYLVYLQSDGWLIPGLVWSAAGWLGLELTRGSRWTVRAGWWAAAVGGAGWAVLMRHNAAALLPVFAALAAVAAYPRGRLAAALAAALVVALPVGVGRWVNDRYQVLPHHPEDQILALDLVGVCVERPDLRPYLPYTDAHLIEDRYRTAYVPGFTNPFFYYHPADCRPTRLDYVAEADGPVQRYGSRHAELVADYREAVRHAPLTLAAVKARAFVGHLLLDQPGERWLPGMPFPERFGKAPPPVPEARALMGSVYDAAGASSLLRQVFACHLPWLLLTGAAVAVVGRVAWDEGRRPGAGRRWRVGFLVLLLPAAYYGSHLPAVAGPWYRYMYPATLLVQLGLLVVLTGAAVIGVRRLRLAARTSV